MRNPWAAWALALRLVRLSHVVAYVVAGVYILAVVLAVVPWPAVAGFLTGMAGHL